MMHSLPPGLLPIHDVEHQPLDAQHAQQADRGDLLPWQPPEDHPSSNHHHRHTAHQNVGAANGSGKLHINRPISAAPGRGNAAGTPCNNPKVADYIEAIAALRAPVRFAMDGSEAANWQDGTPSTDFHAPQGVLARRRKTILNHVPRASVANLNDMASNSPRTRQSQPTMDALHDRQTASHTNIPDVAHVQDGRRSMVHNRSMDTRQGASNKTTDKAPTATQQGPSHDMPAWKQLFLRVLNHRSYYWFLCLTTLYIIFEDDMKRAFLPPTADLPLECLIAVVLLCIVCEMGLSSFVKPGYVLGFYFWVDCIVCTSLFFEVPAVKSSILGMGQTPLSLKQQDSFITWAGNRVFISSKVARVARIFRLLRLLRLYSIYKRFEARRRIRAALAKAGITPGQGNQSIAAEDLSLIELEILHDQDTETRVGQKLEELIIRRIIVFVLVCVLLLPAFEAQYGVWGQWQSVGRGGLHMLHDMAVQYGGALAPGMNGGPLPASPFTTALMTFLSSVVYSIGRRQNSQVLLLVIKNATYISYPAGTARRYDELSYMTYDTPDPFNVNCTNGLPECPQWHTFALYDWKWYSQVAAILSISRTIFIIGFLTLGAWLLNRDSRSLVLEPIERMLARVSALAENPLALQPAAIAPWQEQLENMAAAQERQASNEQRLIKRSSGSLLMMDSRGQHIAIRVSEHARGSSEVASLPRAVSCSVSPPQAWSLSGAATSIAEGTRPQIRVTLPSQSGAVISQSAVIEMEPSGPVNSTKARKAWTLALTSAAAATKWRMGAVAAQWRRAREATKGLLRRVATNFWDGTDEVDGHSDDKLANACAGATYETQLLENSIQKIGALLAVGFGDAGAEVIAENIRSQGDINPMVPGRKTVAVFGFCDIRRFTDATEVLQEEVMEFVNSIARIVHTSVSIHGGAANKNIGDAFLLVWKLPKGFTMKDLQDACACGTKLSPVLQQPYPAIDSLLSDAQQDPDHQSVLIKTAAQEWAQTEPFLTIQNRDDSQCSLQYNTDNNSGMGGRAYPGMASSVLPTIESVESNAMLPLPASLEQAQPHALDGDDVHSLMQGYLDDDERPQNHQRTNPQPIAEGVEDSDSSSNVESAPQWPNLTHRCSLEVQLQALAPAPLPLPSFMKAVSKKERNMQRQDTIRSGIGSLKQLPGVVSNNYPEATSRPALNSLGNSPVASSRQLPSASAPVSHNVSQSPSVKKRLLSSMDNRVVPTTGDASPALAVTGRVRRVITRQDMAPSKEGAADDLESEAVRRVNRMITKGANGKGKSTADISLPEKAAVVAAIADNALASFIIIHAALKRSVRLARYAKREDLAARLGPNFRVQMGFGLHVGWAIEGAIGSEYKIDASYLSPNVNMASRLEAATKQFGVSLLMSESFVECLSGDMRARVRQIDCVTVKGSTQPMGLFTYDIDLDNVPESDPDMPGAEEAEEEFWAEYAYGLRTSSDLTQTWGVTFDFLKAFNSGFQAYKAGDWSTARQLLKAAAGMRTNMAGVPMSDSPSTVLLNYMEQFDFQAPTDWRGFRELTEK